MTNYDVICLSANIQCGAATCSEGFVKCFPRVPQAIGLYSSCQRKQWEFSENILQNLWNKLPPPQTEQLRQVFFHDTT